MSKMIAVLGCLMLLPTNLVQGEQLKLDVDAAYQLLQANKKQTTWLRVGLTGFELETDDKRAPVNIALVLDRSGSMQGEKLARAREAAVNAIHRLNADDIVSVITYDSTVNVLVPATKLTDKDDVIRKINGIKAGGSTALFAGVSKGAAELRKFMEKEYVNRIILLSDGKANSGPSSPGELGALGASLGKESISVSTLGLGLGYNEDLMFNLASRSGGNHEFVEDADSLAAIFDREFDDVTSVVAQEIKVKIQIPEGIRPVRVLGNEAEINGQDVVISMSQIYSLQDRHVVVEVEVPAGEVDQKQELAKVSVSYKNMKSSATDTLTGNTVVSFSESESAVEESINRVVWTDVVALIANEQSKLATIYLDQGFRAKCVEVLQKNGEFLKSNAAIYNCPELEVIAENNTLQKEQVESNEVNRARKSMRGLQYKLEFQQVVDPAQNAKPKTESAPKAKLKK